VYYIEVNKLTISKINSWTHVIRHKRSNEGQIKKFETQPKLGGLTGRDRVTTNTKLRREIGNVTRLHA